MSLQTVFFAFPADIPLPTLIGPNGEMIEEVQFIGRFFHDGPKARQRFALHFGKPMFDICMEALESHPELASLTVDIDADDELFHYLLSGTRRGEPTQISDLPFDEVFAFKPFHERAFATQGVPVSYLSATSVKEVAIALQPMNHFDFGAHFDRVKCVGCYWKSSGPLDPYEEMAGLHKSFYEFRQFFVDAAHYGHAAFRVTD